MTNRPLRECSSQLPPCSLFPRGRGAVLGAVLLGVFTLLLLGANAPAPIGKPGEKLSIKAFTKEGPLDTWLTAETWNYTNAAQTRFEAMGVKYIKFKGNAANDEDTVLVTPAATVLADQKIIRGDSTVKITRPERGMEMSGEQWSYDQNAQTIVIEKNIRTVFRTKIPPLLK